MIALNMYEYADALMKAFPRRGGNTAFARV